MLSRHVVVCQRITKSYSPLIRLSIIFNTIPNTLFYILQSDPNFEEFKVPYFHLLF